MERPLVSIVIPAYNSEQSLPRTLASVLESCEAESEIIVVDDCSRLPVAGWLPSSMEGKARIIRHSVNRGPGAARNTGIGAARGKWIAFVDADDVIRAGRFEEMIDRAGGLGVDVIADDLEICIEGDQRTTSLFESRGLKLPEGAIEVSAEDFVGFDLGLLKPIVRSDALLRTGIRFSEDFRAGEDFHFMLNLILQGVRMGIIKDAFYVYTKPSLAQREKTLHNFRESLRATDSLIYNAAAGGSTRVNQALKLRRSRIRDVIAYNEFRFALSNRSPAIAIRSLVCRPTLLKPPFARFTKRLH